MIYRLEKTKGSFTQIHNNLINDNRLSANAKAILIYMLSKNENWQFYETDILNHFADGVTTIKNGIKELMTKRYIERTKIKTNTGKFTYVYDVYEQPELNQNPEF